MRWTTPADLPPELRERWAASRVWAAHQVPYLASALLALDPVVIEDPDGVDLSRYPTDAQWRVYLDPAVLAVDDVPTVGFWLVHQVAHLLRSHGERFPGAAAPETRNWSRTPEQRRWNVAADAEINDDLVGGELVVPDDAVTPTGLDLPDGLLAEQYWDALSDVEYPDCGGGADGQPRPYDKAGSGLSATACTLLQRETARRIREHVRQRGDKASGWLRWADDVLTPTVNWRRELAAHVRRGVAEVAGRIDMTYRRPSRRAHSNPDVILPSLRQPVPNVAIVIDTSGSVSDQMLGQAMTEVGGVLRSLGVGRDRLRLIACDARAYEAQSVRNLANVELAGGGGTDMRAGLDAAAALTPRPDLVIVMTDGFTPWPAEPPKHQRVVVGLLDEMGDTPPWADFVLIGDAS
jgi:predicted metal-dependent peptidase